MSLFLGKIHFWLYNKIIWFEQIEEAVRQWGEEQGLPMEEWTGRIFGEFGEPTGGKPLEEIIDTSNIHGWLQDKIEKAELRQAALVTEILRQNSAYKEELVQIFATQGRKAASEYEEQADTPEEAFDVLNDFILEGMPCDRVNQVVSSSDSEFVWKTTRCLHKPYWERTKGDVQNYYDLREAWIRAFVQVLNPELKYEELPENTHRITR